MARTLPTTTASTSHQCLECGWYAHENVARTCYDSKPHAWSQLRCIDAGGAEDASGGCSGDPTEYRFGYGLKGAYPRCGGHHATYLERMDAIRSRYPDSDIPPADFDPTYAGESWDED